MKIAAAYIRVSTEEQTELSPDSQIKLIREYAKKNDFIVPDEFVFHDDGISGRTTAKRPDFNRMIGTAKLKPKPFDAILVWKFSRFARNREDSIVYKSMLRKLGIDVISISENVGDDKMSVLIEAMIEAMDEYYSINLAEEVKRGMLEKLSRGQIVNAPPLGYTLKDGKYVPDENADLIRQIYSDFISGEKYLAIAKKLNSMGYKTSKGNKFENRTVEYIIRNPVYAGKLRWTPGGGGSRSHYHGENEVMIVDGAHEPIIEPELWEQAQKLAEEYKKQYSKYSRNIAVKKDFMLRGLLRCSNCGAALVNSGAGYQCHRYARGLCEISHYISKDKANSTVINGLKNALKSGIELNIEIRKTKQSETNDNIQKLLNREYDKLQRIREAYVNGIDTIDEYKANKIKINKEIERLKATNKNKPIQLTKSDIRKNILNQIKNFLKMLEQPDITQTALNLALRKFVDRIEFKRSNETVTVFYYM